MGSKVNTMRHVIIVTHDNESHISTCLSALPAAWGGKPFRITVVDNASRDRTVALVRHGFPEVHLIPLAENIGFARAVRRAYRPDATYTLLLNPDTVPQPNSLLRLENALHARPSAGAAGPALITPAGNVDPRSARQFPSLWREFWDKWGLSTHPVVNFLPGGKYYLGDQQEVGPVPVLSGAAMMIRSQAWEEVGGLDPAFWLYAEDTDFCRRLWDAGWECIYVPHAHVIHQGGGSSRQETRIRLGIVALDSMYRYMVKHHGYLTGETYRKMLFLLALAKGVYWLMRRDKYHLHVQKSIIRWAWAPPRNP